MNTKKALTIFATGIFGVGKIFSTSGQFVFILENGFKYFEVTSKGLVITTVVIGGLSTAYVRGITRFPALWQLFTGQTPDGITIWEGTTPHEKINVISLGCLNALAAIADGIQAYLGSNTMLEVFGLQDPGSAQTTSAIIINGFLALSCTFSYLAFFSKKSIQNSLRLQRELRESGVGELTQYKTLSGIAKTVLSSGLAGTSYVSFIYYSGSSSLRLIWPDISTTIVIIVCSLVGFAILATFLTSRCGEAYRYFTSDQPKITEIYCNTLRTTKDKLIVAPHWIIGFVDIITFILASYFSFLGMFSFFGIGPNLLIETLPILACLSVGFMHYVFSVRPAIKTCIENRESYVPLETPALNLQDAQDPPLLPHGQDLEVENPSSRWSINCLFNLFSHRSGEEVSLLPPIQRLQTLPRYS